MPRYKLTIEYHGSAYVGWQRQDQGASIQQSIEEAVFRFSGEDVRIGGAGRTDAGVHATGQVAHLDLTKDWSVNRVREALNAHLRGQPISILAVEAVKPDFDARFSATQRHYLYRIVNRRPPLALEAGLAWHVAAELEADLMHQAAQHLVGHHDFTTFRAAECQAKSPVKTLDRLDVARYADAIEVTAVARSFLHSQVRSMVGSLVQVGRGKWSIKELKAALDSRDRSRCGPLAPPDGLYLTGVDYDRAPSSGQGNQGVPL